MIGDIEAKLHKRRNSVASDTEIRSRAEHADNRRLILCVLGVLQEHAQHPVEPVRRVVGETELLRIGRIFDAGCKTDKWYRAIGDVIGCIKVEVVEARDRVQLDIIRNLIGRIRDQDLLLGFRVRNAI